MLTRAETARNHNPDKSNINGTTSQLRLMSMRGGRKKLFIDKASLMSFGDGLAEKTRRTEKKKFQVHSWISLFRLSVLCGNQLWKGQHDQQKDAETSFAFAFVPHSSEPFLIFTTRATWMEKLWVKFNCFINALCVSSSCPGRREKNCFRDFLSGSCRFFYLAQLGPRGRQRRRFVALNKLDERKTEVNKLLFGERPEAGTRAEIPCESSSRAFDCFNWWFLLFLSPFCWGFPFKKSFRDTFLEKYFDKFMPGKKISISVCCHIQFKALFIVSLVSVVVGLHPTDRPKKNFWKPLNWHFPSDRLLSSFLLKKAENQK